MREEMAERLAQQQALFDEQITRLQRAAQQPSTAPAPPSAELMHMRPIYSITNITPVVNPALAQMQSRGVQPAELAPASSMTRRSGKAAPTAAELFAQGQAYIALGMADYERRLANLASRSHNSLLVRAGVGIVQYALQLLRTAGKLSGDLATRIVDLVRNMSMQNRVVLLVVGYGRWLADSV